MSTEIRGEKIIDGKKYITVDQVVKDYLSNRSNKTEDADFEVVEPLMIDAETVQEGDARMLKNDLKSGQ
jgi:hypothetical protein